MRAKTEAGSKLKQPHRKVRCKAPGRPNKQVLSHFPNAHIQICLFIPTFSLPSYITNYFLFVTYKTSSDPTAPSPAVPSAWPPSGGKMSFIPSFVQKKDSSILRCFCSLQTRNDRSLFVTLFFFIQESQTQPSTGAGHG